MAIQALAEKVSLKIELDGGIVDGKQKISYKTFSKIKTDAANEDLHGTAVTMSNLQEKELFAVKKIETSELSDV